MSFHVETDHKTLVSLLCTNRRLEKLPLRVQRFRLRLMQYQFTISHVPGRNIHTPDTLPSCPVCENRANLQSQDLATASNEYVDEILDSLPVQTKKTLAKLRGQQDADETCYQLKQFCRSGWPPKHKLKGDIKKFWAVLSELPVKMAYYYVVADWLPLPRCKQRFCKSFIWDTLALLNVERAHDQQLVGRELRHNYRIILNNVQYAANKVRYQSSVLARISPPRKSLNIMTSSNV